MHPVEPRVAGHPDQPDAAPVPTRHTWYHKLAIFLFIIVCFEVGAFLAVFPWTPQWETNSLANLLPWLRGVWGSSYFRGALSGLGLLNIYISLGEVSHLRGSGGSRPPSDKRPPAGKLPPPDKLEVSTL
jgi:hypothetical protein